MAASVVRRPRYEPKADFANDSRLTHTGKLFQINLVATHYVQ
jgi:hypothetical protein